MSGILTASMKNLVVVVWMIWLFSQSAETNEAFKNFPDVYHELGPIPFTAFNPVLKS